VRGSIGDGHAMSFVFRGKFLARAASPAEVAEGPPGYDRLITSLQSAMPREPVDKSSWRPCHACGAEIPVLAARGESPRVASRRDFRRGRGAETPLYRAYCKFRRHRPRRKDQARRREDFHHGLLGSFTYVCPRCCATQVGTPPRHDPYDPPQTQCHVCEHELGDSPACPSCGMLRSWTVVGCPTCGAKQAVEVPHLTSMCDLFVLDCVACETRYCSLCIC
jgi:hypothetical protein